ncbi:MAG: hypothetical protein RJA76_1102 [Bacteroidota bacterium]|jgi:hypothetical protein
MKKLKIVLSFVMFMVCFSALSAPKDSVIVRIDARNQEVIGSNKKGLTLKEEVSAILEKKGIVLSDSLWQQVRTAIRKEDDLSQRLEFETNGQKVIIGLLRPGQVSKAKAISPAEKLDGITIRDGKEEVKISLKEGIHVKDGRDEVLIDWDGIRVKDGSEETKIIWGNGSEKKKTQGLKLFERSGFDFNLGLNNWTGDLGGPITIAKYPAPLLESDKTLNTLGSRYVSMEWKRYANLARGKKSAFRLGFGLGIEWYNLMFDHSRVMQNNSNAISFLPTLNASNKEIVFSKNKLAASYLTLPIMPHISFDEKSPIQMIAIGGYISYRIDSWVKTKEDGSGDKNHYSGNYLLNDFRTGGRMEVALRHFPDFFLNMDFTPMFQKDKGSNLQLISFGVKLL